MHQVNTHCVPSYQLKNREFNSKKNKEKKECQQIKILNEAEDVNSEYISDYQGGNKQQQYWDKYIFQINDF